MNKDEITGKIEQVVGKTKQGVGEAVGSDKLANEGVAEQVTGAAKEIQDFRKEAATEKMDEKRGQISQAVTDAKKKAKEKIDEFKERHTA